jgi:hypothetical protein
MRVALKTILIIWAAVAVVSFGGLVYLAPFYLADGAFSQALHGRPDPALQYWVSCLELFFLIGLIATFWLWRTYKSQYGRFWGGRAAPPPLAR